MEKLYELMISYETDCCKEKDGDLIKLGKSEIDAKIREIVSGGRHGTLYVVEIDTLKGTGLVNKDAKVVCYYDKPQLADIVAESYGLDQKPEEMTFYIEQTIKEIKF